MADPIFPDRLGGALRRIAAFNLQAEVNAGTAAAMLKALRAAELSDQPLAVGLADALKELLDRDCLDYYDLEAIVKHLRTNKHA